MGEISGNWWAAEIYLRQFSGRRHPRPARFDHKFGVKNLIVNSTAARDIILQDCGDRSVRIGIVVPRYIPAGNRRSAPVAYPLGYEELLIGSGVPTSKSAPMSSSRPASNWCARAQVAAVAGGAMAKVYLKRHYGDHPPVWIELNLAQPGPNSDADGALSYRCAVAPAQSGRKQRGCADVAPAGLKR
jgi:hypothetical protein